jgi:hypothetical protein
MMLVEQIGAHGQPILQLRVEGAGAACRVGRDLGCDIVLNDEHVAPQHALLTLLEDGRVSVRDLGTRNGTRVDSMRVPTEQEVIVEQGEVIVGRTRLYIRTRHAPVRPERVFRREFVRRHGTLLATAGVSACLAYGGFLRWLEAPSSMLRSVTIAGLVALGLIAVWAGLWALTTKLNHGRWHFRVHATIASIGAAFGAWGYWVAGLVAFSTQWWGLVRLGVAVVGAATLVALYLHLREATHSERRAALGMAGSATLVIGAIAWIMAIGSEDGDVRRVNLGPEVRLGAGRVAPNRDIADYLTEVDELQRSAGRERQKSLLNAPLDDAEN